MSGEFPVEYRLYEGPQQQAVVRADEVESRPHDDDAHCAPLNEQLGELVGPETVESRPQPRVRIQRQLRLQADEVLDGVQGRDARTTKQQLSLERRPVQG